MFLEVINAVLANECAGEEGTRFEIHRLTGNVVYSLNCSTSMRSCYNCDIFCTHTYVLKICLKSFFQFHPKHKFIVKISQSTSLVLKSGNPLMLSVCGLFFFEHTDFKIRDSYSLENYILTKTAKLMEDTTRCMCMCCAIFIYFFFPLRGQGYCLFFCFAVTHPNLLLFQSFLQGEMYSRLFSGQVLLIFKFGHRIQYTIRIVLEWNILHSVQEVFSEIYILVLSIFSCYGNW